jgi:hypothetical protein
MAYPDFGGGAAYGDAYEQGAGFYAAGAENESPNKGGKNSKSGQPVIPVTVCQIMVLMRETGGEGSFTLDVRSCCNYAGVFLVVPILISLSGS